VSSEPDDVNLVIRLLDLDDVSVVILSHQFSFELCKEALSNVLNVNNVDRRLEVLRVGSLSIEILI
jgi:hypothetical protein